MRRSKLEVGAGSARKGSGVGVIKDLKKPQIADGGAPKKRDTRSHIFDGQSLTSETAVFQLCDIEDPMLMGIIRDPDALSDTCNVRILYLTVRFLAFDLAWLDDLGPRWMVQRD